MAQCLGLQERCDVRTCEFMDKRKGRDSILDGKLDRTRQDHEEFVRARLQVCTWTNIGLQ
jgi:hypothetical protein